MPYVKNVWVDEVLSGDARYDIAEDGGTPIESNARIELATSVVQAGTPVDADKMNNIEEGLEEIDGILQPFEDWVDYSATSTLTGWSSTTTKIIQYTRSGKRIFVAFDIQGTSNAVQADFTLPVASASGLTMLAAILVTDNGVTQTTPGRVVMVTAGSLVQCRKDMTGANFTASGTKRVAGEFWYMAA